MRRSVWAVALGGVAALAAVPVLGARQGGGPYAGGAEQEVCTAPGTWFPATPRPVNFQVGDSNCRFHQWAWQEFLWLTQPSAAGTRNFLSFAYPDDLFRANPLPYPGRAAGGGALRLAPRDRKDDESIDIGDISQAGTDDILIDAAGHPVYYTILIDSTWYEFARGRGFNTAAGRAAAPDTLNFPTAGPGSVELKTSWRVAQMGDSVHIPDASSRFITARARVAPVSVSGGKFVVARTSVPATVALVGMHVVGTVPGHPEFIWASFEHVDNAPSCAATPAGANNPVTGRPWSLYTGNPTCRGADGRPCNAGQNGRPASFAPTPVCQLNPWGAAGGTATENTRNILTLNASVAAKLPAGRAVLRNYALVGGQWTSPGGLPAIFARSDSTQGQPRADTTNIHGSPRLANTTMESFTQTSLTCFSCHNPSATSKTPFFRKNISVSHTWPLPPGVAAAAHGPARPAELVAAPR